eukprot:g6239.t1
MRADLTYSCSLIGYWVVSVLFAFYFMWFVVGVIFLMTLHPVVRSWWIQFWPWILELSIPCCVDMGLRMWMGGHVIGDVKHAPFRVKRTHCLRLLDFFLFVNSAFASIGSAVYRVAMGLLFQLICLFRIDIPLYPPPFRWLDTGHRCYMAQFLTYDHQLLLSRGDLVGPVVTELKTPQQQTQDQNNALRAALAKTKAQLSNTRQQVKQLIERRRQARQEREAANEQPAVRSHVLNKQTSELQEQLDPPSQLAQDSPPPT